MLKNDMSLSIFNTLSRQKEIFTPLQKGKVNMYVCGMTVYDYCHLGHARVMVVFDIVQRWLRQLGYQVTYVRNITDIDDKIIQRALENKESITDLTQRFIVAMHEDADALGVQRPDHEPKATEFIDAMRKMIGRLVHNGLAYRSKNGDVHYSVRHFENYGKLSGKSIDELKAGERVEIDYDKNDPLDFVLWKASKESEPNEVKWDSPWGQGRPGWHIECSAMSTSLLGEQFDIHGGGADLQFPHHENEIAQSEGASDCHPVVRYWMHNGFVRVDDQKMSKSLGNFFTIRELLKQYDPEVIRFFILRAHYRSPLNYADVHLEDAKIALQKLYLCLQNAGIEQNLQNSAEHSWNLDDTYTQRFCEAMNDDFNTSVAIATLFDLVNQINKNPSKNQALQLQMLANSIGLLQRSPKEFLQGKTQALEVAHIQERIHERSQAKQNKDYAKADQIRKELEAQGILLEDKSDGSTLWRQV